MKKMIAMLLAAVLLLSLFGCEETDRSNSVWFYYRATEVSYEADSTLLEIEYRDASEFSTPQEAFVAYLAGPFNTALRNPFPAGLSLISLREEGNTLYLTLSDALGSLTGLELTIALCCIAKTGMALTGAETVCISAETLLLDGERSITLNEKNMNLLDISQQARNE